MNKLMTFLVHVSRLFVGAMFVFSGVVKLVDPIGSQYKFEEYFSEPVLDIPFLVPYALAFSIVLIIVETMLGVLLLIGYKSKTTLWSLFLLSTVFLFLTWYSAYYNKVTDCGCFGDAIKLTPWETFYKNILLIFLVGFMLFQTTKVKRLFSEKGSKLIFYIATLTCLYTTYHVLRHLPLIDFRPYAIGKNIPEGMTYFEEGELPAIDGFALDGPEGDLTDEVLSGSKVMLVVVYNSDKSDTNGFSSVKDIAQKAVAQGYSVYGVSASLEDDLAQLQEQYALPFDFLFCDETILKTMIRSNPGIITMEKGTITGKWNWADSVDIAL